MISDGKCRTIIVLIKHKNYFWCAKPEKRDVTQLTDWENHFVLVCVCVWWVFVRIVDVLHETQAQNRMNACVFLTQCHITLAMQSKMSLMVSIWCEHKFSLMWCFHRNLLLFFFWLNWYLMVHQLTPDNRSSSHYIYFIFRI